MAAADALDNGTAISTGIGDDNGGPQNGDQRADQLVSYVPGFHIGKAERSTEVTIPAKVEV